MGTTVRKLALRNLKPRVSNFEGCISPSASWQCPKPHHFHSSWNHHPTSVTHPPPPHFLKNVADTTISPTMQYDWVGRFRAYMLKHLRLISTILKRLPLASNFLTEASTHQQKVLSLARRIPPQSWDSHMHIIDPKLYPLSAEALYTPQTYTLDQALAFEASVGLSNIVIVQPSIYGNDNSCLLNALRVLGPRRGRGVVAFDPATTELKTLQEWHRLGVRAVRINIQSIGKCPSQEELQRTLQTYADAVRPLGWAIQVYVPLPLVDTLEPVISTLGVRFCIDHLGHPCLTAPSGEKSRLSLQANPYDAPGFAALIRLLEAGNTFVKLSAPYRISKVENQADIEPFAKEILKVAGKERVVFATDWPHTRYEGLDIMPWVERVLEWCGDDSFLVDQVFRRNAEALWDARS